MTRAAVALSWVMALAACGDSGSGTGGSGGTAPTGGSPSSGGSSEGGGPPAESCIQPGELGNEIGVGEYCTPLGGECADNTDAQLCLADVGQDQWMCSRIGCTETTDCGEGAGCLITSDGSACVPCMCDDSGIGCGGVGGAGSGGAPTGGAGTGGAGGA